jgi:putative ABC transport system permease protein
MDTRRSLTLVQDTTTMCWRLVVRNRKRYFSVLIMLAVGVAGLLVILGVGDSVEKRIGEHIRILGETTIIDVDSQDLNTGHPLEYSEQAIDRLRALPHVLEVARISSRHNLRAYYHGAFMKVQLAGVDQRYWHTIRAYLGRGRLTETSDENQRAQICVLGADVARCIFIDFDPLGKDLLINGRHVKVIGLLEGIQDAEMRRTVFVPITTAQVFFEGMRELKKLRIKADSWVNVPIVKDAVTKVLRESLRGYEDGIRVQYYPERIRRAIHTVRLVRILACIGIGVAIMLGGAGLTSLMSLAVIDRTKEVGIKKAIGATDRSIFIQFMGEALIVCFSGGVLGVVMGLALCLGLERVVGTEVDLAVLAHAAPLALLLTLAVGVAAGLYPARKAALQHPAEALLYE